MKTLSIVLLAVCLVSAHAYVKREAESPKEQFNFGEALKPYQQAMSEIFNPEKIQKQLAELMEGANKAVHDFSNAMGSHKEENKQ